MHKAMREAKVVTSWINPSERHEEAMAAFVGAILSPENTAFREDFEEFQRRIAHYGIYNSLSQLAVKIAAPGVPDFYQGTELWDFSLVDPDNRRPVDYRRRELLIGEVRTTTIRDLMAHPADDRLKLFVTSRLLAFRRDHADVFAFGSYEPLAFEGPRREHAFGFIRRHENTSAIAVVPRLIAGLVPDGDVPPIGERVWGDTRLRLPGPTPRCYRHALTGVCASVVEGTLRLADVFSEAPVAIMRADT
jgi:(1->4)-alpha-D-glucan 1-alpha-D-glucosylmutase